VGKIENAELRIFGIDFLGIVAAFSAHPRVNGGLVRKPG
jgi:hypothetical protein